MDVDIRMTRARSQLIRDHAFFGSLAMRLRLVQREDVQTMATNGTFLFFAKKFLDTVSEAIILFAVAHEVLHCALGHHTRRGGRDRNRWNIACDHVVNLLLRKAGFHVPEWAYCGPRFAGMGAEQVYRVLEFEEQQQKQQEQEEADDTDGEFGPVGDPMNDLTDMDNPDFEPLDGDDGDSEDDNQDGDDQCESSTGTDGDPSDSSSDAGTSPTSQGANASQGNGSGSQEPSAEGEPSESAGGTSTQPGPEETPTYGDPGGCGEILDAAPQFDEAALDKAAGEWQVYTRQAANIARRAGEGKLPGFAEELIQTLDEPKTDWRDVLHRFVDPQSSTKDYTWTKPNLRYVALGYYTPGVISDGINHVAIVIDSSASVDMAWLQKFGGEAQAALDLGIIDKVTVIFADDGVHRTEEYSKGEIIDWTVQGRGGTAFSPSFRWIDENAPDVSAAIYFTDLECSDFGPEPPYPVLWAAYGVDPRTTAAYMANVPWGECVELVD